ncbi:MAG TPA: glycosyltransferase family 1 protein [Candidatus Dormibacteraeota bacterium]|nr:glycosyltransferase family 1 protein [Candidatus Dormibacteraeota bacterium]
MRVLFDSSVTDFDRGGTSRYVAALLPRLQELGAPVDEVSMQTTWRWSMRLPRSARVLLHDLAWVPRGSVSLGRAMGATLYHGAGFKVPPSASFPTSVTIHDDTPWDDPPTARLYNRVYMRWVMEAAAPHLAGAITSTETTAAAIRLRLPSLRGRLHVTPWGVDHHVFRPRPPGEVARAMAAAGVAAPFVLLVSPYGPRKNAPAMLDALSLARSVAPRLRVLVVGRHDPTGLDPLPVVRCGRVSDDDLAALYSGAEFLLYTSLKEGFGLPVLEALACGCPAVVSQDSVLQEIGGGGVLSVNPAVVEEIAAACRSLLTDRAARALLAERGRAHAARYTWEETARLSLQAWEKMA